MRFRSIALIIAFAGAWAMPALAQDGRCAAEQNLRSANSNAATTITFFNRSSAPVSLFWLNFDGQREHYGNLTPGQSARFDTYVTHPWVVEHESGGCMGIFFPEMRHRDINIG
jgi:hypothetical protein